MKKLLFILFIIIPLSAYLQASLQSKPDPLFYMAFGLVADIYVLIGYGVWDRLAFIRKQKKVSEELIKEVEELKEKVKTTIGNQEKITTILKRIIEIEPRFTGLL